MSVNGHFLMTQVIQFHYLCVDFNKVLRISKTTPFKNDKK